MNRGTVRFPASAIRNALRYDRDMSAKPSAGLVIGCFVGAAAVMLAGVYLGGTGHVPAAMVTVVLFILLGGVGFELARRRSV